MNEAGVCGGNTAVFTRAFHLPANRERYGLTGMELLRLGLERGRSARDVVEAIAALLETWGQWAPAVVGKSADDACYENAFLVADTAEAWILETTGRRWAAQRLSAGTHALSNELSIRSEWTRTADDLDAWTEDHGWWRPQDGPLDFALACSDHEHYARQVSHIRWSRARALLSAARGSVDVEYMMDCLRDHYEDTFLSGPQFDPALPDFLTLCMHDSPAHFTWGNTATSMVIELDPDAPGDSTMWCGYQPPCSSVYFSCSLSGGVPAMVSTPGTAGLGSGSPIDAPADTYRPGSLWWRLFRILEAVNVEPPRRAVLRTRFDALESESRIRVRAIERGDDDRAVAMRSETHEQLSAIESVLEQMEDEWQIDQK
jgi:secernin